MPGLNTSSLPDLIFTVLFFFMIVTHMRSVPIKVACRAPQGHELSKLVKKTTVVHVWIGRPVGQSSADYQIQVNDRMVPLSQLASVLVEERERMAAQDLESVYVSLKADSKAPMGLITDVKLALRQSNLLQVAYSAVEKPSEAAK
jgi:biopolymer transport protein ExbD